ncbi:hypothetical protein B5807_06166 [Epicoccum nigrum]|uniref:F-box domain-containing protein n=1 Tax=Epicoccum nigrum TaxID=105696 RepID=A0A1Y2M3D3_EPING|nr:hypothetical protein B5807_06166 [Epicoccum nigrum]
MSLETLPLELLFRVLDFISNPYNATSFEHHPINSLAATSKHFDSGVEEYTRALLKQHANFAPRKKSKTYTSRRKWLGETCQLCYKKSKRHSTFWKNLTCCLACDRKHFPKVTMTNAVQQHNLSKLDIFTPNIMHPALPRLVHGEYSVMGGVATMVYEPDLVSRRDYIHSQLIEPDRHPSMLRKRIRRHETLMRHMTITYSTRLQLWCRTAYCDEVVSRPGRPSLEMPESREEYVRTALAYERLVMGMKGSSEDNAIKLE